MSDLVPMAGSPVGNGRGGLDKATSYTRGRGKGVLALVEFPVKFLQHKPVLEKVEETFTKG